MKAYFVSDIHLGSASEPNYMLFKKFLQQIKSESPSHLFLVGDIFDIWLGDHKYFLQRYSDLITELKSLSDGGVEIHYFEGNHDLYLKSYWQRKLGFIVHEDPEYFELGKYGVRVEHGDQVDPEDKGYIFLRWFLRTPIVSALIKNMPGSWAAKIGEKASEKSRAYTSEVKTITPEKSLDKLRQHAQRAHHLRAFDFLISGHIHVRDDYKLKGGKARSVNLGTWLEKPCAFLLDDNGGRFVELSI